LQSQGGIDKNKDLKTKTYSDGIICLNFSENDSESFKLFLRNGLPVEPFGVAACSYGLVGGVNNEDEGGLVKSQLAVLCCNYLITKKTNSVASKLVKGFRQEADTYLKSYGFGMTVGERDSLVEKCKKLMTPFGADSWAEIDAANSANVEAKNN
jgi:hypothetical protein